jgi:toxin ParE1/3/4
VTRFIRSPQAERDLDAIKAYLVEQAGAAVARGVLLKVVQAIRFLASHPKSGHLREELSDPPTRFWSTYSYVIIYDPSTPIEVLRVIHGARDVTRLS